MSDRYVKYYIVCDSAGAIVGMKKVEEGASTLGSKLEATGSKMKSLGSNMSSFGHKLSALSLPILAVGGYSIKMAMDFQTSMTQIQTQAGASAKEMKYLEGAVLKMGHTGFAGKELSEALYPIRSDGFKGAEALEVLKGAAAGAQVSGANLTLTANALGGTLRTRLKDVHNAAQGMQILNSTVGLGKFKLEELDEALTTGFLTAAKRAGIGLAETGDALDALARKSIPPQIEATRLQKTLIQFSTVTGVAKKELGRIGIGQLQLAEDMKKHGLIYALQELQHHLKKLGSAEQNVVLGEAFGRSKGSANVGALLESLPEMEKIQKDREKYGSIFQALGIKESTSAFKMAEAIANLKDTLIQFGQVLIPVVVPALVKFSKIIISAIEWVKRLPKPLKDVAIGFVGLLAVGGPLLIFFGNMLSAWGSLFKVAGKLIKILPGVGAAAGEAGTESSAGISGLLLELAPLLAAAAALLATYEAIRKIKEYLSAGGGSAHSPGAKGFQHLEKIQHLSNFHAATGGALAMLRGGVNRAALAGIAPGSAAEALYLKEHAGAMAGAQFGGSAAPSTAAGNAFRQKIRERNEQIVIHNHIHLDGKEIAQNTAKHTRNDSTIAKQFAESAVKYAQRRSP